MGEDVLSRRGMLPRSVASGDRILKSLLRLEDIYCSHGNSERQNPFSPEKSDREEMQIDYAGNRIHDAQEMIRQ